MLLQIITFKPSLLPGNRHSGLQFGRIMGHDLGADAVFQWRDDLSAFAVCLEWLALVVVAAETTEPAPGRLPLQHDNVRGPAYYQDGDPS